MDAANPEAKEHLHDNSDVPINPTEGYPKPQEAVPAVRFASTVQEIPGPESTSPDNTRTGISPHKGSLAELDSEDMRNLSKSLHGIKLQEKRLNSFSYEPLSLPTSRVPSNEESARATPQISHSTAGHRSPKVSDMASPPLTPAGTSAAVDSNEKLALKPEDELPRHRASNVFDSQAITPQVSGQSPSPASSRQELPQRPSSAENISQRSTAVEDQHGSHPHRRSMFTIGPGGSSVPASRETSPSRTASNYYTRPFTPAGDANDPYAASKRAPQARSPAAIDQRFVFSRKKKGSPASSSTSIAKSGNEKRHSGFLGVLNKGHEELQHSGSEATIHSRQGSMSDLKRFFKVGGHNKMKKEASPSSVKSGAKTPPINKSLKPSPQMPFADDHGLSSKYGKIGKVLGSGAGGSVRLMKRAEDNTVFAVKEFRPRHSYETEKEYSKKLTAEFCIGSALHHGNIIETMDIVKEKGKWYEVMEYAPYDLFAIVMTGKMSREEVTCCFLQILSGVTYLHSSGLAHRDLKLDNVVVSEHGIMKIIDFGSAHVFRYPFETEVVLATGIVGSDPYLAPEVYDEKRYDPQAVDIWSLAIIFCCMSLRRFPWKQPRLSDNSYKLFAAPPTPGHDPKKLILPSRSTNDLSETKERDFLPEEEKKNHHSNDHDKKSQGHPSTAETSTAGQVSQNKDKEIIKGPWRLLRLLPRESRHIIGRMLTINPKERAKMDEILEEPWVADTVICRQIAPGHIVKAEDHTHILEPPQAPSKS